VWQNFLSNRLSHFFGFLGRKGCYDILNLTLDPEHYGGRQGTTEALPFTVGRFVVHLLLLPGNPR